MSNVIRLALPGYNALTDTNPDHFSLFSDEDNVLIKELANQSVNVAVAGGLGYTKQTISHGLGYIPLVTVWADILDDGRYVPLNNSFNSVTAPLAICAVDTENLYIINLCAYILKCQYRIFYDDMSNSSSIIEIDEDPMVVKVAREGRNAFSKNPNDFIMHSSLNNLKILHQDQKTISLSSGGNSFSHDGTVSAPIQTEIFAKFPDGKTACLGNAPIYSYDETKWLKVTGVDETEIFIESSGSFSVDFTYFLFGVSDGIGIPDADMVISCARPGINALTNTDPDNLYFDSRFPTLKYYTSSNYNMGSVTTTTVQTIAHNLGYTPFFAGYVSDLHQLNLYNGNSEPVYALTPYYLERSTVPSPTRDVGAFIYADNTNLYLKAYFQTNAIGTSFPFNQFYYKLFKNNLAM